MNNNSDKKSVFPSNFTRTRTSLIYVVSDKLYLISIIGNEIFVINKSVSVN